MVGRRTPLGSLCPPSCFVSVSCLSEAGADPCPPGEKVLFIFLVRFVVQEPRPACRGFCFSAYQDALLRFGPLGHDLLPGRSIGLGRFLPRGFLVSGSTSPPAQYHESEVVAYRQIARSGRSADCHVLMIG